MTVYEGKYRITYYDLDFRGKVKLSAILRMVHIAAEVNANDLGLGFETLQPLNISFVIQRFGLKIARMPAYNETVTIRTWPAEMARGTFIRKGDMHDAEGQKIMEWASLWILFDIGERKIIKPQALPKEIEITTGVDVDVKPQKVPPAGEGVPFHEHIHTVRYADVDTNIHMNNSIYGDLIGNAVFTAVEEAPDWKEVQINYLGETQFGDEIKITAYKDGEGYTVGGQANGRVSFAARIVTSEDECNG